MERPDSLSESLQSAMKAHLRILSGDSILRSDRDSSLLRYLAAWDCHVRGIGYLPTRGLARPLEDVEHHFSISIFRMYL